MGVVMGPPTSLNEDRLISQWLDARHFQSVGVTVFLERARGRDARWQLVRLYDVIVPEMLLGVAVVLPEGTCFWLPEEVSSAEEICPAILDFRPRRIVTSPFGRDLLHRTVTSRARLGRGYDQLVMICACRFATTSARTAIRSDLARLAEYQRLYNHERSVDETPDWEGLIADEKIAVYEVDGEIVSVVRQGIETNRLVSIGGTYTFPSHRRRGFADGVVKFAVDRIVAAGRVAHLVVDVENNSAVALYRRIGFECVGSSYVGYLDYA